MFVLLLFVLPFLRATVPNHRVLGAVTASIDQVSLVEDYLWVRYPYFGLTAIPLKLSELVDQLSAVLSGLGYDNPYPDRVKLLLADRL